MLGRKRGYPYLLGMIMAVGLVAVATSPLLSNPGMGTQEDAGNFHHTKKTPKVDYDGLFNAGVPVVSEGPGRMVLDACLEAYGGRAKLAELENYTVTYRSSGGDEEKLVTRTVAQGRKYKYTSGNDARYLDGTDCWYTRDDQVANMDGGRYRAELFSYMTMAMPLVAETERFDGIRYGKQEGSDLDYLYFDKADSLMVILGLDPETKLIRESTGVIRQDEQIFVFTNEFDDYRMVDGFWFPHKRANISLGLRMGEMNVEKIEINRNLGDGFFRPRGD